MTQLSDETIKKLDEILLSYKRYVLRAEPLSPFTTPASRGKKLSKAEAKAAIQAHTNAEIASTLDRLTAGISADIPNYYDQDGWEVAMKHIQAERAKLKEVK